jgi:SAM-dependent methyltransferase
MEDSPLTMATNTFEETMVPRLLFVLSPALAFTTASTKKYQKNISTIKMSTIDIHEDVQTYYGKTLQTTDDLKTNACCAAAAPPKHIQDCLSRIHPTILSKYYGCGLCLPNYDLNGMSILDLGCGAGRDVYIASQLVGPKGRVVGVDMTVEQLETAREYQDYHAKQFGSNTEFYQGYLENLEDIKELEPGSFDVIISNCVMNLCADKPAVLKACYNLLKPGGEFYFSDVYCNRRVPLVLQQDKVLWGECLSGALYWNDFENMARRAGFADPRLVEDAPITVQNKKVQERIAAEGDIEFYSATYRLWKIDELEPACEDYGQAVIYKGTLPQAPSMLSLDKHHRIEKGRIFPVCGNTYRMLSTPALKQHFDFIGSWDTHYGIFEGCGGGLPYDSAAGGSTPASSGKGSVTNGGAACCT